MTALVRFISFGSALFLIGGLAPPPDASPSLESRPNIVFILVDDLGYGQLGLTGHPIIETPNIDRLAAQGVVFDHAYAGSTVCSPSRISLMTGKDTGALHSSANSILLRDGDRTTAHMLSAAGYRTALFGKWGIGTTFGKNDPMTMGFDTWTGVLHNITAHRQYPTMIFRDSEMAFVPGNVAGAQGTYAQRLFTDEALSFLGEVGADPFFLYLSYTAPHADIAAPADLVDRYAEAFDETPYPGLISGPAKPEFADYYPEPVAKPQATLAAMITALDGYVGEVLSALDASGHAENTIVIFTSDNGPHSEGGVDHVASRAAAPYRGGKRDLYDGGIHVPFIARWPAAAKGGRVVTDPISFADILPTLAEASEADATSMMGLAPTGLSILGVLTNENDAMPDRTLYWAFTRQLGDPNSGLTGVVVQAARRGRLKAVRLGETAPVQLYDILDDPSETHDLAAERPADAASFAAYLDARLANVQD